MQERRKLPRKYLMAFSSVKNNQSGIELGYLCDMNLDGMMIIGKEPHEPGQEIELYIELPEKQNFPQKSIIVKAELIWTEPDIDPRLFNMGFKFLNLAEADKPIITNMIKVYEFRRNTELYPPSTSELNERIDD